MLIMTRLVDDLFYPRLSYKLNGILFSAHNELGRYSREKQYGDFIEKALKREKISFKREIEIGNTGNIADFVIKDLIVLELKNVRIITKKDYFQIQRYLHTANIKLGIIVNFRQRYLKPKRIIRTREVAKSNN